MVSLRETSPGGLIRLSKSAIGREEKAAVARVLEDGFLGMGPALQSLKARLESFLVERLYVFQVGPRRFNLR